MSKQALRVDVNYSDIGFLFDLDGVLIDSEQQYSRLWHEIDTVYPTGVPDFERIIKGTTLYNILDTYFPNPAVRTEVERMCIEGEKKIVYGYAPGAKEMLDDLKSKGVKIALVTSSDAVKMHHLWGNLPEMRHYFDAIVDGDCVSKSKPDPEGYIMAAGMIGIPPQNCVVIEDSLKGMQAGRNAGCSVVGLSCTMGEDIVEGHADEIFHTLADVDADYIINHYLQTDTKED